METARPDRPATDPPPLLDVRGLTVRFDTPEGEVAAVNDLSFALRPAETLGVVGESGSGKSQAFLAIMGLLAQNGRATGSVRFHGQEILGLAPKRLNRIRGSAMSMIFQDPMTSLNPFLTVARQMTEVLIQHKGMSRDAALRRSVALLDLVRIPDAKRSIHRYPHEFSGGMRQRATIAMALLCQPALLIADEPTTALDVTVQAQILDLLGDLKREFSTSIVLVTHDLGVIAGLADRVMVMYGGRTMEAAPVRALFYDPQHPYTAGLLRSMPRLAGDRVGGPLPSIPGQPPNLQAMPPGCPFAPRCPQVHDRCRAAVPPLERVPGAADRSPADARAKACYLDGPPVDPPPAGTPSADPAPAVFSAAAAKVDGRAADTPLLRVRGLKVHFPLSRGFLGRRVDLVRAVDGIDLDLRPGETLGIVGESGCGKSTLGRAILRLVPITEGRIVWQGTDLTALGEAALRPHRADMQIVFQDPLASLDPRMTVGDIVAEPLKTHRPEMGAAAIRREVATWMERVGLLPTMLNRFPHEFSGGQCQRIGIARAMILKPKLVVCDEPVSALDVSIQSQIVNLLMRLQAELGTAMIFIGHDLSVTRHIAHRTMVLYLGRTVELAPTESLFTAPKHPYTKALIEAIPLPDPDTERAKERIVLTGDIPSPRDPPSGCRFRTRCPMAQDRCAAVDPPMDRPTEDRAVACHFWRDVR